MKKDGEKAPSFFAKKTLAAYKKMNRMRYIKQTKVNNYLRVIILLQN